MSMFEKMVNQSGRKPIGFTKSSDRRQATRLPQKGVSHSNMMSHLWELELLPAIALTRLESHIIKLAERTLEPNLFFETEILLSAWPRLTSLLAPHGCWMLCLWETIGETRELRLFMPVRINKVGLPRKTVLQPLSNEYAPVGTPLVDAECVEEATETLLRLLGDPTLGIPPILDLSHQRQSGGIFKAFCAAADSLGLPKKIADQHDRAALFAKDDPDAFFSSQFSKKRRREFDRQYRRLNELGELRLEVAHEPEDVLNAFEGFVTLELQSWKGRRGTALYSHKKIAAFSRQIVVELAMNNGCEIFSLKQKVGDEEQAVGALIMLGRNGHLVPWKMAFDEKLSAYSPGMQTMIKATETLLRNKDFKTADSLAIPDHWMMNSVWPDRISMVEMLVCTNPNNKKKLEACLQAKQRHVRLKNSAKSALQNIKSFKKKLRKR